MKLRILILLSAVALFSTLLIGTISWSANPDKCEDAGGFLILKNQSYALCATANCFNYNQLAYCKCDVLRGDSISEPFDFGINQNICTLNQDGRKNGYRASTFSYPEDVASPGGNSALYTCPGEANKNRFINNGYPARGTYSQCDGGICFTSTRGKSFPGFPKRLRRNEIMCSCPYSTSCENLSESPTGYQISGDYNGQCSVDECSKCNNGALSESDCSLPNPILLIANGDDIPVGAPAGTPEILSCLLLGSGNVPNTNSCVCQCESVDANGICTNWAVFDESPLSAVCN